MGIPFEKHGTSAYVKPAPSIKTAKPVNIDNFDMGKDTIGNVSVNSGGVFRHLKSYLIVEGSFT